jgi:hypothetical protein
MEPGDLTRGVIPGQCDASNSGAQLRTGESRDSGSGPSDHPGMMGKYLDGNGVGPYSTRHEQRRDHHHRSPPPHFRGMGGRLHLRLSPLPPDLVRGIS